MNSNSGAIASPAGSSDTASGFLLQEKPAHALLTISRHGRTYASVIARDVNTTFAHTVRILNRMEQYGLLTYGQDSNDGRVKYIELTRRGKQVAGALQSLLDSIEGKKQPEQRKKKRRSGKPHERRGKMGGKGKGMGTELDSLLDGLRDELAGKDYLDSEEYASAVRRLAPFHREAALLAASGKKSKASALDKRTRELMELCEQLHWGDVTGGRM